MPWNICHSGADNLAIYDRIATFGIPIQKRVTQVISSQCSNLHSGLVFGERPYSAVDSSWGVEVLNTVPLDHPQRMYMRWLFHDGRVRIIRSFSMFLSRALGVSYVDPLDLSTEELDGILWCRRELIPSEGYVNPARQETRQRILDTVEALLPFLSQSLQGSLWEDGIPDSLVEYILNLTPVECASMTIRINAALDHPEWAFAVGLWRCAGCNRAAVTTYGSPCNMNDCEGTSECVYTNTFDGTPFILVGFCGEDNCHFWGRWGFRCQGHCSSRRHMRLFTPPVGHDATVFPYRPLVRRQRDGVPDVAFTRYNPAAEDVLRVCTEIRESNANAVLPGFLCRRNNPRGRLRTTNATVVNSSEFGRALREGAWQGDGVLVIGDITYTVVDRYENVDHFS